MASVVPAPMINAKVYKHFALITVAITLCVAVMADGEAQQVVENGIAQQQERVRIRKADKEKNGVLQLGKVGARAQTGFGEDYDAGYGVGTEVSGSGSYGEPVAAAGPPRRVEQQVLSPDQLEAMSPAQRAEYDQLRKKQGNAAQKQQAPTREEIRSLMNASAARSGSNGIE